MDARRQSFDDRADSAQTAPRLAALRAALKARGLDGFVVPHADEFQNEFLPARHERLAWLTGFTGSAGTAIVLADKAALFVDGRYTLQAAEQVNTSVITPLHDSDTPPSKWIEDNVPPGAKLGYDPRLHTVDGVGRLKKACAAAKAELVASDTNPLDAVWRNRPPPPLEPAIAHDIAYSGRTSEDKRTEIAAALAKTGVDAAVLTSPVSVAWLLNIRGKDAPRTPIVLAHAIVHRDGNVDLFIDPAKVGDEVRRHLGNAVTVLPLDAFADALDGLGRAAKRALIDPALASAFVHQRLADAGAAIELGPDPCALPRARKNAVEIAGMKAAHRRDGAALTRFLAWLAREASKGELDEIAVVEKLESFRAASGALQDLSFDTIAGSGPNGAVVHYRVTQKTNRRIRAGELLLVDSGGQYRDGTTDVTRTVAIGQPTEDMLDRFTRVLKGHIALATLRFPKGVTGSAIDALARRALWQAGLDFDHGTGHGVGSYLGVHEGPQYIARRPSTVELEPGMVLSNEPGYYKTGAYGIRIENLVVVTEPADVPGGERPMMGFETITLAPIDRALVKRPLLTDEEAAWLNAYHARVRETLTPLVDADTAAWLDKATSAV